MHEHVTWQRPGKPDRCIRCGHRTGENVRQTREQAPWKWPVELIDRRRARLIKSDKELSR